MQKAEAEAETKRHEERKAELERLAYDVQAEKYSILARLKTSLDVDEVARLLARKEAIKIVLENLDPAMIATDQKIVAAREHEQFMQEQAARDGRQAKSLLRQIAEDEARAAELPAEIAKAETALAATQDRTKKTPAPAWNDESEQAAQQRTALRQYKEREREQTMKLTELRGAAETVRLRLDRLRQSAAPHASQGAAA